MLLALEVKKPAASGKKLTWKADVERLQEPFLASNKASHESLDVVSWFTTHGREETL